MSERIIKILLAAIFIGFGLPQAATAQTCAPAPVGLVAAWSGDNHALDARSRSNGSVQGNVTYSTGEVGQGFQLGGMGDLSGNGDRVIVGNPANLRLQDFTIEAWVKRTSSAILTNSPFPGSPNGTIFAYGQNGYGFVIDQNTNKLGLTNVGNSVVYSNLGITDTNWHHVAVTKSGNQVVFYLDGAADAPMTYNTTFGFTTNAAIGARGDSNALNAFFGGVDELGIYNRPLAAAEIASIFNAGTTGKCKPIATYAPDNQVLWLAGDGDALDSSNNGNNGALQGGVSYAVGRVGQGFQLNGNSINGFVQIPDNPSINFPQTSPMSVEMWVYRTSSGTVQHFIGKRTSCATASFNYQFALNTSSGQGLTFGGGAASGGTEANTGQDLPMNTWVHLAGTFDGSTVRTYINGVLAASATGTLGTPNSAPLLIGSSGDSSCPAFGGQMDEVALYNRALSANEIQSIVNAGLAGKYKAQSTVPSNLAAWYPGDGSANDIQGGNNATLQNGATYGIGKVGQGFQFDGADDQVAVPHNANQNGGGSLTLEAWINPTVLTHSGTIIQKRTSGNVGGYVLEPTQPSGAGAPDGLQFVIMIGGVYQTLNPANVLAPNVWQHVAATYDGAFMRIYVNGVEVANRAQTGAIDAVTTPVIIGRNAVNTTGFSGVIDEIGIYNRALPAAEIRDQFYAGSGGKYKGASVPTVSNAAKTGAAAVTFGSVATAGAVHLTPLNMSLLPALPSGTNTGFDYDVSTSAVYTNPAVCFNLSSFTPAQFANLRVYHLESGAWQNRTAPSNSYPNLCTSGLASLSPFAIGAVAAPSAANTSISGRVVGGKSGLSNVVVTLSGGDLPQPVSRKTNVFGYYKFDDLPVGETYILTVSSKKYVFSPSARAVNLYDEVADADFAADGF